MGHLFVVAFSALVLFVLAYMSRRRFGVLVLSMAAGLVISNYESIHVTNFLFNNGVVFGGSHFPDIIAVLIILIPSIMLFFGGPSYYSKKFRFVGSLIYAFSFIVLSVLRVGDHFLAAPYEDKGIVDYIWYNSGFLIVLLLILALVDVFMVHSPSKRLRAK